MTLTIELTPEQEAALQAQASAVGMETTDYIHHLLVSDLVPEIRLARQTFLASTATMSKIWDTEEEDHAWANL